MKNFLQVNRALAAEKNFTKLGSKLQANQSQMARNLHVIKRRFSSTDRLSGSRSERSLTSEEASIQHPLSIHSASIEHPFGVGGNQVATRSLFRIWKYAAMITLLLTLVCGQAWGESVTFTCGTTTGYLNLSSGSGTASQEKSPITVNLNACGGKVQSRTIWFSSGTGQSENAFSFSSNAGNDPTSKYIEITAASGYKITAVSIRGDYDGAATDQTYAAFFWSGAYSSETGAVLGTGTVVFPGKPSSSAAANVNMSTITDGTRTIRVYKQVKYNSSTKTIGNVTSAANTPSSSPQSVNISQITVTYSATSKYTLAYDANGGTGSMPAHEFVSGTTVYAGQNAGFTPPTGKIFKCWNTQANGEGTEYKEGASFTLSANTTLYAQWKTASTSDTYCISMYNLSTSDEMKYFTYSGYDDMQILDLEVPNYNTGGDNFWVGKGGSWKSGDLGNSGASSANERLENLCLKGNRTQKLGTGSQGVLARFFVYDNSTYNNIYIEFSPKQYSLIWGEEGKSWDPVKLYPSGCENEWTSEVVTLTSDHISNNDWKYYVGILKADDGVAYWYKSKTSIVSSMGTYNKTTDAWGGNVSTLSAGDKGFFRMWQDATDYDNWRCHFVPVYTLSYNANGGSGAPANAYVATEGDAAARTLKVSTTEPTRNGYSFEGWAESSANASAGTVDYAPGASITLSADQELWAVWKCVDPTITTDLSEDEVDYNVGASATALTVAATAAGGSVSYQWYSNDEKNTTTPTTLTTGASYTPSTAAAGTTYYYCVVTNSTAGCSTTTTSSIAKIVVSRRDPEPYTFSADNTSICSGNNVTFTLADSQVGATYYITQSSSGGSAIGDSKAGTGSSLTFTASSAATGDYYCYTSETTAFNAGKVSKKKVTISYKTATSVTVDDATLDDAVVDEEYTISGITGAGAGTLYYQWYLYSDDEGSDETEIDGADADTYAFTPDAEGDYYFKCEVTGDCGSVKSELITVTAAVGCSAPDAPTISGTTAYTYGGTISLTASCESGTDASTTYTWYKGSDWATASASSPVQAASTSGATFSKTAAMADAGTYWCEAANSSCKSHNSSGYAITVAKASISPSLSYSSTSLTTGDNSSSPTVSGNTGSGSVSYAVTSSSPSGCITVNGTTGVVTAVAEGTGTVTATIAATDNYLGSTATADFTVTDPCFQATITKTSGSYTLSTGNGETKVITSDASVTSGGVVRIVNNYNGSKSFSFGDNGIAPGTTQGYVEFIFPTGTILKTGSVIRIQGKGTADGAGLDLIDDDGETVAKQTNNGTIDFTYTVIAASTINGNNHLRIARIKGSSDNYLKTVTVTNCGTVSCSTSPTVTAGSNSSVAATTATVTCALGISSLGSAGCEISSYGFVLGTSSNPTTSNTTYEVGTTYTSTGVSFSKNLTGLTAGTTYYVRPYATNGNGTSYGTQTSFTTHYAITTGSHTNGSVTIPASAASGATVNISATGDTGYGFTSWTIINTDTEDDVTSTLLGDNSETASTSFTMPSYGITISASFSLIDYTVTLYTNDGTINTGDVNSYNYGTGATLPTDVTKDGYRFMGWRDNSGLTGDPVEEIGTSETGNKEYWAKWAQLYTITTGSHANGVIEITNSSSEVITEAIEGETVSIDATAGTHYAFSEWSIYKTSDGETSVPTAAATASTSFTMPAYGVTVNASFAKETLTLAYAAGGATGSAPTSPAAGSIDYGTVITVPDKGSYAKSTDGFVGWLYNGTTLYTTGQKFTMTENVTLTAVWNSDCPAGGSGSTIFKAHVKTSGMSSKASELSALTAGSTSCTTDNYLSELDGGTLSMTITKAGNVTADNDSTIKISGKGYVYFVATLSGSKTFQAGDIITLGVYNQNGYLQIGSGDYSSATDITVVKDARRSFLVPNDWIGENTFYIKAVSNHAKFAYVDVYRPGEVLFFAEVNNGIGTGNLGNGTNETEHTAGAVGDGDTLAVISGGKLYTKARAAGYVKAATNEIRLTDGANDTYIRLSLDKALAVGDKIIVNSSTINYPLGVTTTGTYSKTNTVPYTIPAESGMIGENTIYLWENSSASNMHSVAVIRPDGGGGSDCKFDVSFANKKGFSGGATVTLPSNIEGVPTGKKLAQPADPTTTGDYVFGGWYSDEDCTDGKEIDWSTMTITGDKTIYAKWYDADYTITWMVNGETYATTKACDEVTTIVLPAAPADNTLSDCANSFRGWSETNLYGEANDEQPSDLFIDPADAPTIDGNKTFYAVFGTATDAAYKGTVLWSEDWTGADNNSTPTTLTSGGYAAVGAVIGYTWVDGTGSSSGTSKVATSSIDAGGVSPEAFIGKKGSGDGAAGGYLTISGIPRGNAKKVTVEYKANANRLVVSVSGTGYSGSNSTNTKDTHSFDVTCGTDETFSLTFTATTTSNVRLDDIVVKVKEDGATDYRCICPLLTVTPELITASTPIFITSGASKTVRSQDSLLIVGSGLDKSATLTLKSPSSKFALKTRTNEAISTDETGAIDAVGYIFYTPDAGDTSDDLDKYSTFTVTDGSNDAEVDQALIGRHLPADFVIVAKRNNKWYALPATMDELTNPSPVEISVDDIDNPSVAYSATSNIYNLYGQSSGAGYLEEAGQYIKLGMKNNSNKPLFGSTSSTVKGDGTATVTNNIGKQYWWLLTQTKTGDVTTSTAQYSISCANNSNPFVLKENSGNPQWGFYASGSVGPLRILPVESGVGFAEAEIVAWGKNSAIVEVDNSTMIAHYAIAKLPEDIESPHVTLSQTRTSVKNTGTRYNYTMDFGEGVDFSANDGKMLTLEWYDILNNLKAISNIMVPCIVAEDITIDKTNYPTKSVWNKEVHVLPGVTVTVDADYSPNPDVTIKELVIYPGAKVVAEGGTLKSTTLVLRNGWNRLTAKTEYNIAQLYITPTTGNLQATNAYADWYIDYDQYYPIAVPWKVATANISYRNMTVDIDQGLIVRYYNGERHAGVSVSGTSNWTTYTWGVGGTIPTYLEPGIGYAITARRPAGKAFSIIRMPLSIPSNAWTSGGEQGNVTVEAVTTHKDEVTVTAWAKNDGSTPDHAKGWNFVANPYMASYEGEIAFTPDSDPGEDYDDEIAYVNIPDVNFKEFDQVAAATAELKPGSGVLIQTKYDGKITFATGSRKADAPAYRTTTPRAQKQKAYIRLSGEEAVDQMGLIIADRYTADYELNADLEKLLSDGNTLRTYMQYGNLNMAYVAINRTLAQEWIPVSVRIPATGEYTYSIHRASRVDELEGLYLIDYTTNEVTNLLESDYVFTSEAGTITDRFAINAIYGPRDTPTDLDVVQGGGDLQTDQPIKFIYNNKIYIYYHGIIYDTAGKKVAERRAAL